MKGIDEQIEEVLYELCEPSEILVTEAKSRLDKLYREKVIGEIQANYRKLYAENKVIKHLQGKG